MDEWLNIQWREPIWLLLVSQPLIVHALRRLYRQQGIAHYADKKLLPWVIRPQPVAGTHALFSPTKLYFVAWLLLAVALAGPRLPQEIIGEQNDTNVDIEIVLDISRSMQVMDEQPNRLVQAQLKLHQLLPRIKGPRVGLIVYAARPHVLLPLTADYTVAREFIDLLDELQLPTAGSQLPDALTLAMEQLKSSENKTAIILITDGDLTDVSEQSLKTIADTIQQSGTVLSILGIGTVEGDAIPLPGGGWLEHDGRPVISRAQPSRLNQLADWAGGRYGPVSRDDQDWEILYEQNIKAQLGLLDTGMDNNKVVWHELFPLALLPAILLFFFATFPYRLSRPVRRVITSAIVAALCLIVMPPNPAQANDQQNAYQLFKRGNYAKAKQGYAQLPGYSGRLGEGASLYLLQDYDAAITQFSQAALAADNDQTMATALYNLGNSYFQTGNYAAAAEVYHDALSYRAEHAATQNNLNISLQLKARVEQRLHNLGVAPRPGRGPQTARVEAKLPLRNDTGLSLDQTEKSHAELEILPPLPAIEATTLEQLIENGLRHVRVAVDEQAGKTTLSWDSSQLNEPSLDNGATSNQADLWRRLFELEEGFQAPVTEARPVPGVAPW